MRRFAFVLAVVLLVLDGCSGGGDQAGAPRGTTATTDTSATTESTPAETSSNTVPAPGEFTSFGVFFLRDAEVAPVYWTVPKTQAVATAAMDALLSGPSLEEVGAGIETEIPKGTKLMSLDVTGGVATVDLSPEFDALREPDSLNASLAQITYTLTQFPTIRRVWVAVQGEPVGSQARPMTRASNPKFTPLILIEHPAFGETVTSPISVSGTASVFEATLRVRLEGPDGSKLWEDSVTASEGAPGRGSFAVQIPFTESGPGTIVAFSPSAKDGSEQDKFEVEVVLGP